MEFFKVYPKFHAFYISVQKIENPSKSLQLEERLAREELDNVILEEVAMDTIRSWAIRMCANHKTKRTKPTYRRRVSGELFKHMQTTDHSE